MSGDPKAPQFTAKDLSLGLIIFGSALALGTEHAETLCVVAAASAAVLLATWRDAEPLSPRTTASTLLWVCIGLTAFTLFQCIPLPLGLLGALAPQNADVWMRSLTPLHQDGPSFAPISLDPNATHVEVLRGITYAIVFLAAIRLTATRRGVLVLSTSIVVTGLALGLAALLHPAFGLHKVFGIYQPETQIGERHIAPLLNPNTLAAYINIAFALSLAQAIAPRPQIPRYASAGAALFLIVVQVWVASRGGMLSMGIAALAVFALDRAARSHTNRSMRADVIALAGLAGVAVVMIVLGSADEAWTELASKDLSKFSLFKNVLLTVRRFPIFGLGRGAFQSVFPADRQGYGFYVFTHPENVILQWTSEWGVPVGLAGLGAVAWALRPRVALARGHVAIGAWASLFAVAVHNLVDFSSEVPGVVLALVVCGAIVTGGSRGEASTSRAHVWGSMGTRAAVIAGVAAVFGIAIVAPSFEVDLYGDRTRLHELANDTGTSREEFDREARAAMLRHPAEPYLPFMGAVRAARTHDESAIPWAEKVLERAPVYGPVHIVIARELRATRPAQARVEYRYALVDAPEYAGNVPAESAALVRSADDAFEIAPPGMKGVPVLSEIAGKIAGSKPATAWMIGDEILARDPNDLSTFTTRSKAALADLDEGDAAPWCADRKACVQRALDTTSRLVALDANHCESYRLHALAQVAAGKTDDALAELTKASDETQDGSACLSARVDIARKSGTFEQTTAAIDDLVKRGCANPAECANDLTFAASVEAQRGSLARALAFEKKADEAQPECDACLAAVGAYASSLGLHAEAMDAYAKLSRLHPEEQSYARSEAAERQAMLAPPK